MTALGPRAINWVVPSIVPRSVNIWPNLFLEWREKEISSALVDEALNHGTKRNSNPVSPDHVTGSHTPDVGPGDYQSVLNQITIASEYPYLYSNGA